MTHRRRSTALAAVALLATVGATTPATGPATPVSGRDAPVIRSTTSAAFGPPWLSIEYPVNPYDRETRDAYLVVHTFHHQTPVGLPVSGRAEGIVKGARRTIVLEFGRTSKASDFTLRQQWPGEGNWVLVIEGRQGDGDFNRVSAIVDIGKDGRVSGVRVPTTRTRDGYQVPAAVTATDVDAALARVSQLAGRD